MGRDLADHTAIEPRPHQPRRTEHPHPHTVPLRPTVANRIGACKAEGRDKLFGPLLHPQAKVFGPQPVETAMQHVAKGIGLESLGPCP